jgi:uncharacterized protein
MLQLLLSHGADVHACTDEGDDALAILVRVNGSVQCAKVLLAAGADAAHLNSEGISSLQYAVSEDNAALLQLLLQHGAAAVINQESLGCVHSGTDLTALMVSSSAAVTKLLLQHGADHS